MNPYAHCCIVTTAKTWKQPKGPLIDKLIRKLWGITQGNITQVKKGEIFPFATT